MKKFKVNVDGETFEVAVEEMSSEGEVTANQTATVTPERPRKETTAEPVGKNVVDDAEGEEVAAALPGVISSIEVSKGDKVSEGDVLFIHEAMKMENEIKTPVSGTVKSILISEGEEVDTDEVLAIIG